MPYSASFPLSTPYLLAFSLFLILTGYGRFSSFVVLPFALLGTGYIRSLGIFEPTINNNLFLCLVIAERARIATNTIEFHLCSTGLRWHSSSTITMTKYQVASVEYD
ncbi:hypothetical protein HCDG_07233 [Histoplasma capsulatum H143]|uniref:Uncharacterized protein n=1 Tax=Ajellomyces capsulatus (strain H143) TaxID=544712 RepID=C6HMB7_AJECH|nr:hypothetical protein HCDG_07233 [Histoplasma capsulatum H143]